MPETTITLDAEQAAFAAARLEAGTFADLAEMMREAFRLLAEREAVLDDLRAEIAKGEASGEATEWDLDSALVEWRNEWDAEHGTDEDHHKARSA